MKPEDANRERLVQFLRDEDAQQMDGFSWNFSRVLVQNSCGSVGCAIGAAMRLGIIRRSASMDDLCDALGLPRDTHPIFLNGWTYGVGDMRDVTATMVADKIEEVAAKEAAP